MSDLTVHVDDETLPAEWADANPETRATIADTLPINGDAARWGDELYVGTDVDAPVAETRTVVKPGTIAYWPSGPAICLFWGPTPASTDDRPRAASPVAVIGRVVDVDPLQSIDGPARLALSAPATDRKDVA
ncbi:hypothetical protein SAMN05192561_12018 [Halopenitus malekzadehii]|uniref:Cyclophilin TM1367-like domain-containing protein n=1 Tax=Halopenitus malekzadehii TaxID=1267564 RepID=A0A1H6JQW1_9EURY|nr:cyclophilin-like family protein [Halopenitus malekzadehii]SEH64858.1 hypothetical protein SAMN05192561_12018 [Halopenitus malekzadehii]